MCGCMVGTYTEVELKQMSKTLTNLQLFQGIKPEFKEMMEPALYMAAGYPQFAPVRTQKAADAGFTTYGIATGGTIVYVHSSELTNPQSIYKPISLVNEALAARSVGLQLITEAQSGMKSRGLGDFISLPELDLNLIIGKKIDEVQKIVSGYVEEVQKITTDFIDRTKQRVDDVVEIVDEAVDKLSGVADEVILDAKDTATKIVDLTEATGTTIVENVGKTTKKK